MGKFQPSISEYNQMTGKKLWFKNIIYILNSVNAHKNY